MPTYEYECGNGHRVEELRKITEPDEIKDRPCQEEGCDSAYEMTFDNANVAHSWRDGKPTPRFHR